MKFTNTAAILFLAATAVLGAPANSPAATPVAMAERADASPPSKSQPNKTEHGKLPAVPVETVEARAEATPKQVEQGSGQTPAVTGDRVGARQASKQGNGQTKVVPGDSRVVVAARADASPPSQSEPNKEEKGQSPAVPVETVAARAETADLWIVN